MLPRQHWTGRKVKGGFGWEFGWGRVVDGDGDRDDGDGEGGRV